MKKPNNKIEDQLQKLEKLLEIVNVGITKEQFLSEARREFTDAVKKLVEYVKQVEGKLSGNVESEIQKIQKLQQEFEDIIEKSKQESDNTFAGFRRKIMEAVNFVFVRNEVGKKIKELTNESKMKIDEKIAELTERINQIRDGVDGRDGEDADEEKIVEEVLDKLDIPDYEEQLRALDEKIETIRKMKAMGGGGTSAIGIANAAKYFVKTEKPSGTIDGTNKAFSVNKPIMAILAMSINGEFVAQLPNYTISNKTVTFSEAIPAAYSGKDFEVTYI